MQPPAPPAPLPGSPVVVVPYDPEWPRIFERLRAPVAAALGAMALAVEHVGSTAVPGLAAKPVIDMDVVVPAGSPLAPVVHRLAALGYAHEGDLGVPGRDAFRAPRDLPAHHLYVCARDADELRRHLAFRDHLRTHADAARAYAALKVALAARFRADRAAYTEGKAAFVAEVLRAAGR